MAARLALLERERERRVTRWLSNDRTEESAPKKEVGPGGGPAFWRAETTSGAVFGGLGNVYVAREADWSTTAELSEAVGYRGWEGWRWIHRIMY